jgi:hypothetical protein
MSVEQIIERQRLIEEQNKRKQLWAEEERKRQQQRAIAVARELGLTEANGWRFEPGKGTAILLSNPLFSKKAELDLSGDHLMAVESGVHLTPDSLSLLLPLLGKRRGA